MLLIYVAYCIFDMTITPYESFLLIKNGSSNLKQVALQYIYIYIIYYILYIYSTYISV